MAHTEITLHIVATELFQASFEERSEQTSFALELFYSQPWSWGSPRPPSSVSWTSDGSFRVTPCFSKSIKMWHSLSLLFQGHPCSVCDILQHNVVAVLFPAPEGRLDEALTKSMCHHFHVRFFITQLACYTSILWRPVFCDLRIHSRAVALPFTHAKLIEKPLLWPQFVTLLEPQKAHPLITAFLFAGYSSLFLIVELYADSAFLIF